MSDKRQPSLFIPHGAGPAFFMDFGPFTPAMWAKTSEYLKGIAASLPERPQGIIVISAHWETKIPTINAAAAHSLYYDYYGASREAYKLQYPAKGNPDLGAHIQVLLEDAGFPTALAPERGLDHGVFLPCMLMFPDADIPVVQLSLVRGLDPATHIAIGRALMPLRDERILIVGSGMSFHNGAILADGLKGIIDVKSDHFDGWLTRTLTAVDSQLRDTLLIAWEQAPSARHAHPEPEHFLPLHVAVGAAGADPGRHVFHDRFLGANFSAFHFG